MTRPAPVPTRLLAASALLLACAGDREASSTTSPSAESFANAPKHVEDSTRSRLATLELASRLHDEEMTEVTLDPRGRAALTLDTEGGVRLWPDILADEISPPLELPVFEPVWMSLARTSDGEVVTGFIDTAGGARVGRVDQIEGRARWTPAFEVPPTSPLLELHVLDGGERILALGVDHRIHLWNADGETLSEIDEAGFVPWQLRVAQPPGEVPTVLAVLADPVRVQPISLTRGHLARAGDALPVDLDRGPNRNDLALTPDGSAALVLRRPAARGKRFELDVVDLSSRERRVLAAESDVTGWPRLHPLDGRSMLLESGSGRGFRVELDQATPAEGDEVLSTAVLEPLTLYGSDRRSMLHTVVSTGRRFVPTPDGLVVAPVGTEDHRLLGRRAFRPTSVALDERGRRVAWGVDRGILLETLDGDAPLRTLEVDGATEPLAFLGDETLVTIDESGHASIVGLADAQVIESRSITFDWGIASIGWRHPSQDASGAIILSSTKPDAPVRVVHVSEKAFGEVLEVSPAERSEWPEGGKPRRTKSHDWLAAIGLSAPAGTLRPADVLRTTPDPTGRILAVVQKTGHNAGFDPIAGEWAHDFVVTVFDVRSARRQWTHASPAFTGLAWSGDGRRIAVADGQAGHVLDAQTGRTLHERRDLGVTSTAPRG
jgi:hypothetical protein